MLFKDTFYRDSDAKVALSDPFAVNGEALYLDQEKGTLPAPPATSMKANNPPVKLGSSIQNKKRTFNAANAYRESVAQSAMAPPPVGIPSKVQPTKSTPTDAFSRAIKASHVSINLSRPDPALSGIQSAVPFAQTHVALSTKALSIQGALSSHAAVKRRAPQDFEDDTLCNEPVAQGTRSDTCPGQLPDARNGAQGGSNGNSDEISKDLRPKKRRRMLNEQGEDTQVPQGTENKATSASSTPPETPQHANDKLSPSKDITAESSHPPEESSAAIRHRPPVAPQKSLTEHSVMLQARKSYWSTCSMEAWLTGGQEIADRFSQLLGRGVYMFETDVAAFGSIDQIFDEYKKEVLDNRDQVLRKAKDTIILASSTLVGGEPRRSEAAS